MPEIVMPRLSDSMEEGTILAWMKQVGDEVAVGEELVEIETDKANMAYESDVAGTLTEILAQEGETLPIGSPIAVVGDALADPAFTGGADTVRYDVSATGNGPYHVTAELWYESIGYRWAHNLDPYQADEPRRFMRYFAQQADSAGKRLASASR